MANDETTGLDNPEILCDTIAELIDALEDGDLLTEDRASELRSEVYQSIDLGEYPSEEAGE
ncbi:hypothetical protein HTZ84_11635 [Haloterrigena sp. SYSU A558-1]|uniref:Uncharacterized protein n=1 Tax=Haloterrigena gelatinilytica TaxID=2741724 RepID=A0A8J8KEJ8_9EURY|nr:hypothetical protein [Haloterrigena gelatinilytica]NUB91303.1 hypothetical protein [Haloterrigena gelatinilytica]NUC72954.1 hypothetical protein [Haloterrigena gelatinilytica]